MPSSLQAQMTRTAISPRLAIRTLLNGADGKQSLPVLHRLAVQDELAFDDAPDFGLDLIHELHGFDDAEDLSGLDAFAGADEGGGAGGGAFVESADDGRFDQGEAGVGGPLVRGRSGAGRGGRGGR